MRFPRFVITVVVVLAGRAQLARAQPAGAPPEPATAEPAATPAEAPPPEPTPPPPPPDVVADKVKAGKEGFFQPAILLQTWYFVDHLNDTTSNAFRLRRAEFHFKGQIVPAQVAYDINVDPAKVLEPKNTVIPTMPPTTIKEPQSAISALQDFYITYLTPYAEVSVGQFKIPVSWEGYNPSSKILFPERDPLSRLYGDRRDLGVRITKTFDKFMYSAGVFNGTGQNLPENNDGKDLALRLEAYPIPGLVVAGVVYGSVGDRDAPGAKDRFEVDLRYQQGALILQAEAIRARDVNATGAFKGQGVYAAAALRHPSGVEVVARAGYLDPNIDADNSVDISQQEQVHVDGGINYYLRDHQAKAQLSYAHTMIGGNQNTDDLVILAAQVSY
jgi:Phosphate-selective porin O and P